MHNTALKVEEWEHFLLSLDKHWQQDYFARTLTSSSNKLCFYY